MFKSFSLMILPLNSVKHLSFRILFVPFLFLSFPNLLHCQKTDKLIQKANSFFEAQKYDHALKYYLKAVELEKYSEKVNLMCARSYEKLEKYEEANEYYLQVFKQSITVDPTLFLEYANLQMKLGQPDVARSYLMSYNNLMEKNDLQVLRNIKSIEDLNKYYYDSAYYLLTKLPFNSPSEDYNPIVFNNHLYFETNKDFQKSTPALRTIYCFSLNSRDSEEISKLEGIGASKYQGAGFGIARLTGELIQSKRIDTSEKVKYALFRSFIEHEDIHVSKQERLIIDSFDYNIVFPTLSNNGDILIFASNAPYSSGGWDLYIAYRNSYGYCRPKPINGFVNTLGDEKYPYLANDSILFFASTGQGGIGGFDICYINLNQSNALPVNLGYPVNSQFDDFGLSLSEDGLKGYFASDRASDNTLSDLYEFDVVKILALGVVTDKQTGENLKNVNIDIETNNEITTKLTLADNGHFSITTQPGGEFNLVFRKEGYISKEFYVSTKGKGQIGLNQVNIGNFEIIKEKDTIRLKKIEAEPLVQNIVREGIPASIEDTSVFLEKEIPKITTVAKFRVQIAASRNPLSEYLLRNRYKGPREIYTYKEEGWYKYAIGEFDSYFEANTLRKRCGVSDAFIAAYSDDRKLKLMSAIREIHAIPARNHLINLEHQNKRQVVQSNIIFFQPDEYEPSITELQKLDSLVVKLAGNNMLLVEIDGHTDIHGSSDYNMGLGAARAKKIQDYLINQGIDQNRITVLSCGEMKLRMNCDLKCTSNIHRENRRAEILLYKLLEK
jgi:outer membrane protein OmpA-like peptidoglycan-associated protein/tetratricopeptide (TPR) repeat protein